MVKHYFKYYAHFSVVEFSPATWETQVWFPAIAKTAFLGEVMV